VFRNANSVPPGVLITSTPRLVASLNRCFDADVRTPTREVSALYPKSSGVTRVALPNNQRVGIRQLRAMFSLVVTTVLNPAFFNSSHAALVILSATMTFMSPLSPFSLPNREPHSADR